ncbi:unnamed protein product [Ixodes pacificus]
MDGWMLTAVPLITVGSLRHLHLGLKIMVASYLKRCLKSQEMLLHSPKMLKESATEKYTISSEFADSVPKGLEVAFSNGTSMCRAGTNCVSPLRTKMAVPTK